MLTSLGTAVTGLQQFQQRIDLIGNNIANVGTTAYKYARASSADSFSNTLQSAVGSPVQVGTGVTTGDISSVFTSGTAIFSGKKTDLAVSNGVGFFTVKDPKTGEIFATRDGAFKFNDGYLVNSSGFRVQGFSDAALTTRGDIRLDSTGAPAGTPAGAPIAEYLIDTEGRLQAMLEDGTTFTRGQVLLQGFTSPQSLAKSGNNLYSNLAAAGPLAQTAAPGTAGLGVIEAGALESSNVDLASEFSNLITAQRGFQANSRLITTSDEILQEVINLKR